MLEIPENERRKNSIRKTPSERRTEGSSERRNQGGKRNNATTMEERWAKRYTTPAVIECFHCGKKVHVKRDCRVKLKEAKCSMVATTAPPEWTKTVQINGKEMEALLDTGCTKTLVHPRCVGEGDYLGWNIPCHTVSDRKTYFLAASVQLEVEGRTTKIPVGVSEHIGQDMLMGRDIPHFRHFVRKELEKELKKEEPISPNSVTTGLGMGVTRAQLL